MTNKPTYEELEVELRKSEEKLSMEISRNITEIKKINIASQESEERFRSTFEQAAIGIAHVSPDGHFLRINKRFCDTLDIQQKKC